MSAAGAAGRLRLTGNQCNDVGNAVTRGNLAFAAIQLIRVERGDMLDNTISRVARNAVASPAVDALRAAGVGQLRVAGNRFFGIGPDRSAGPVAAAHLLPPFDRLALDNNSIERLADENKSANITEWRAIDITPPLRGAVRYVAAAGYIVTDDAAYVLTKTVRTLENPDAQVAENVSEALDGFSKRLGERFKSDNESTKTQIALLKSAKLKNALANAPDLQALADTAGKALDARAKSIGARQEGLNKAIEQAQADLKKRAG